MGNEYVVVDRYFTTPQMAALIESATAFLDALQADGHIDGIIIRSMPSEDAIAHLDPEGQHFIIGTHIFPDDPGRITVGIATQLRPDLQNENNGEHALSVISITQEEFETHCVADEPVHVHLPAVMQRDSESSPRRTWVNPEAK